MALIDKHLQLSGLSGAVQDLDPASAASGLYSTDYLDAYDEDQASMLADGNNLYARVTIKEETVTSATANATVEFQVRSLPVLSGNVAVPLENVTTANGSATVTKTAHGIPADARGTRVEALNPVTGYAASTSYFLENITTDTFDLFTAPREVGGTAVPAGADASTMDLVIQPEILGSSGPIATQRLVLDDATVLFRINPSGATQPKHRYTYVFVNPSHDLTAGKALFHLTLEDGERRVYYKSGFTV